LVVKVAELRGADVLGCRHHGGSGCDLVQGDLENGGALIVSEFRPDPLYAMLKLTEIVWPPVPANPRNASAPLGGTAAGELPFQLAATFQLPPLVVSM
jgi:hypothetical protein